MGMDTRRVAIDISCIFIFYSFHFVAFSFTFLCNLLKFTSTFHPLSLLLLSTMFIYVCMFDFSYKLKSWDLFLITPKEVRYIFGQLFFSSPLLIQFFFLALNKHIYAKYKFNIHSKSHYCEIWKLLPTYYISRSFYMCVAGINEKR